MDARAVYIEHLAEAIIAARQNGVATRKDMVPILTATEAERREAEDLITARFGECFRKARKRNTKAMSVTA